MDRHIFYPVLSNSKFFYENRIWCHLFLARFR